jgi:hypothetical protein
MFIVKVRIRGAMVGNDLKFDTHADALKYISDVASRWTLVEAWAIEEAS